MTIHPDKLSIADVQGWRFLSEFYLQDRVRDRLTTPSADKSLGLKRSGEVEVIGIYIARDDNSIYIQDKSFTTALDSLCSNAIRVRLTQSAKHLSNSLKYNKSILKVKGLVFEEKKRKNFVEFSAAPIPGKEGFQVVDTIPDSSGFDRNGVRGAQAGFETYIDAKYVEVLGEVGSFEKSTYQEIPYLDLWEWVFNRSKSDHDTAKNLERLEGMLVEMAQVVVVAPPRWESGVQCELSVMPQQVYAQVETSVSKGNGVVFSSDPKTRLLLRKSIIKVQLRFKDSITDQTNKFLIGTTIPLVQGFLGHDVLGGVMIKPIHNGQVLDLEEVVQATPQYYVFPDKPLGRGKSLLSICTYNVEKFGEKFRKSGGKDSVFDQKAEQIARHITELNHPNIIALQEVGDDSGKQFDSVATADEILRKLTQQTKVKYYALYLNAPINSTGGKPGLNIRNVFLVRKDFRGKGNQGGVLTEEDLEIIDQDIDPGIFIDHEGSFDRSRKPLILRFNLDGDPFVIINVHLSSRLGSSTPNGECADNNPTTQRARQLRSIANYIEGLSDSEKQNLIVLGDFNTYWFCDELELLKDKGLVNLIEAEKQNEDGGGASIPEKERYTTLFEGVGSAIDHIFISEELVDKYPPAIKSHLQIHHFNTRLGEKKEYDVNFPQSDHDPVTLRILK